MSAPSKSPEQESPRSARLGDEDARREAMHAISGLVAAGLPLGAGLRAISDEMRPGSLGRALGLVADAIDSGESIDEAMAAQGPAFPEPWRALLAAGLKSGRVGELTAGLVADQDLGTELRRQLWMALFYPAALLAASIALFGVIGLVTGRAFARIFSDFGISISWLTAEMMQLAEAASGTGHWIVAGPIVFAVFLLILWKYVLTHDDRSRALHALPLVGVVHTFVGLSEFCRVLAWLLRARLPVAEAIEMAGSATRDPVLSQAAVAVRGALEKGSTFHEAARNRPPFPPGFGSYMDWAMSLPNPDEGVALASGIFEERARAQTRFAATFLSALAIAIALWWSALAVVLVLVPMLRMLTMLAF